MLVINIMQVLKNLFGLNKKIAASEIAMKNANNEAITLDEFLDINNTYSSKEQIVGTWIDGKKIYKKVITNTTTLSASSTYKKVSVPHTITNIGDVINCYGSAYFNDYNAQKTFPSSITLDGLAYSVAIIDITNSNVDIQFGYSLTGKVDSKIVILYTKTTD